MRIIETQANITDDHRLNIQLPEDIKAGQYQIAIIINSQPEPSPDPDETPDEIVIEGIKQGLKEALSGQTIPLAQMWEGIDVE